MEKTAIFNWDNGSIIIVFVFSFVVVGLIATVFLLMNNDREKK